MFGSFRNRVPVPYRTVLCILFFIISLPCLNIALVCEERLRIVYKARLGRWAIQALLPVIISVFHLEAAEPEPRFTGQDRDRQSRMRELPKRRRTLASHFGGSTQPLNRVKGMSGKFFVSRRTIPLFTLAHCSVHA